MPLESRDKKECRRKMVVRLHKRGLKQTEIGETLGISQSYVSYILSSYREEGEASFKIKKAPGQPSRITPEQIQLLDELLARGAKAHGFQGQLWTRGRVKRLIKEQFGIDYSDRHVGRILAKLEYTRQRPQLKDYRKDDKKKQAWHEEQLPLLKKKAETEE